jgi:hypothetical protein
MLLSQVIRHAAITGRTDAVGERVLGRQGGQWAHQWVDAALPQAAARTHAAPPPDPAALEDLRRRGVLTDDEVARLRGPR